MYIQRNFGVYFILSSDTVPNMCFYFILFFLGRGGIRIWLGLLCFLINCYEGGQTETSKLLEKILNLFAVYTNAFDQSH